MLKVQTKLHKLLHTKCSRIAAVGVIKYYCSMLYVVLLSKQIKTTIEIPLTAGTVVVPQIINNIKPANASSRFAWNFVSKADPDILLILHHVIV